jgi:uncharacterized protein YkwD
MFVRISGAALFVLVGCVTNDAPSTRAEDETPMPEQQTIASAELEETAPAACASAPATDDERALVCHRWTCDRDVKTAVPWNGEAARCSAGSLDEATRARALRLVNTYRFLAGVPEVKTEPRWEQAAQECALLAHANNKLSHEPPPQWSCWTDLAAKASAASLVANRSAAVAVDAYIEDPGNETTMVHRRWLLGTDLQRVAFGSTSKFSCITVDGRTFAGPLLTSDDDTNSASKPTRKKSSSSDAPFVAWPPVGLVPIEALRTTKVDTLGWTVQSSKLELDRATVEVSVGGVAKKVTVSSLKAGQGSGSAIRFVPDGWSIEAGRKYDVRVTRGKDVSLAFTVEPVDCSL